MEFFTTPILFLIFNRLDTTRQVFAQIKNVQPAQLFIAADGPRTDRKGEKEKCEEVRQWVLDQIDWDCEVKTLFRTENLGCGKAVSEAITWFFDHVEEGIILEDDTLPNKSFFLFCEIALSSFRNHAEVMHISGNNFQLSSIDDADFYLSKIMHVWGWATWKRAWNMYNFKIKETFNEENNFFDDESINNYWDKIFEKVKKKQVDTWDYQWTYTVLSNSGFAIMPQYNLVKNIGFDNRATHTTDKDHFLSNLKVYDFKNINLDSSNASYDPSFDISFHKFMNWISPVSTITSNAAIGEKFLFKSDLWKKIKVFITLIPTLVPLIFSRKPIAIIIRNDAIGDYILFRNSMGLLIKNEKYKFYKWIYIGNEITNSFVRKHDGDLFISTFFWFGSLANTINSKYHHILLTIINWLNIELLINPVLSSTKELDGIAKLIDAKKKITAEGDEINYPSYSEFKKRKEVYDELINTANYCDFELFRNYQFVSQLTGLPFNQNQIEITLKPKQTDSSLVDILYPKDFFDKSVIGIFPYAGSQTRSWAFLNFQKLINKFIDNGYHIIIFGNKKQSQEISKICKDNHNLINQAGKIELPLISEHIKRTQLIISNESMAVHLCAALDKACICLSNGNQFGRFNPYPETLNKQIYTIYSNQMFTTHSDRDSVIEAVKYYSDSDINLIRAEDVYKLSIEVLQNKVGQNKTHYSKSINKIIIKKANGPSM